MTLKKLLSDTAKFILVPGSFWREGLGFRLNSEGKAVDLPMRTTARGFASTIYATLAVLGAGAYVYQGISTEKWTLSGQSQVRQERAANIEQLRNLVDPLEDGVDLGEYNGFREVIGEKPRGPASYDSEIDWHVGRMEPEEVKAAIREYKEQEQ